ncbi:acetate--CoA ligase [Candidatus Peregrinibacteria bacterium]|nr:acetate--CoA ligase [Candidatus Peregrinibacteria bacterium]
MDEKKWYKPSRKIHRTATIKQWKKVHDDARRNPVKFWEQAAKELEWYEPWKTPFKEAKKHFYQWFIGGKCNIVHNALDRHMGTPTENKTAIIWESDRGDHRKLTYKELNASVCKMANGLKGLGVRKGDRVAIYLQNTPEIAISMLACAKIGAMHSVVYAGFSAHALRDRIEDAKAKVLITSDVGFRSGKIIDMYALCHEALKGCKCIKKAVIVKRHPNSEKKNKKRDIWYGELVRNQSTECKTRPMDAEDPLFVLYTSGTTAKPKGIIHVHGGYQVGINRTFHWVMDIKPDDIYWCSADPGWITGHSYIVYAPLMAGVTTVMFEGAPNFPKPDRLWKLVEKYKVTVFYTAPTLIRALMRFGDEWVTKNNLSSLRLLGSVGEPINPKAWRWYHRVVGKKRCPIMDTWWQTETGMFMITPLPTMPLKAGSATLPFPGIIADVVDKHGKPVRAGEGGYLVIKNQWPSMLRTIFNNPKRYIKTYWKDIPGYYLTGDLAHRDKDGYFWIQGRSDDVIKIAGHRIGTAEIESALVAHKLVAEAAVIGKPHEIKGETAKAFVILKKGVEPNDNLVLELKKQIRNELGPIAVTDEIEFVDSLPKTRSGKIMRRILKAKELGQALGDTSALAD